MEKIYITGEYIQLNKLLKHACIISTGGQARFFIEENEIVLNDELVFELRKKIRPGDKLLINGQEFQIICEDYENK